MRGASLTEVLEPGIVKVMHEAGVNVDVLAEMLVAWRVGGLSLLPRIWFGKTPRSRGKTSLSQTW